MQNYKIEVKIPQIELTVSSEFTSEHNLTDEQAKNLLKSMVSTILLEKLEDLGGYIFLTPPTKP